MTLHSATLQPNLRQLSYVSASASANANAYPRSINWLGKVIGSIDLS